VDQERRELKKEQVEFILQEYSKLGEKFKSSPKISLKLISQTPTGELIGAESVASSTAIQCYSPGVAFMKNSTLLQEILDSKASKQPTEPLAF